MPFCKISNEYKKDGYTEVDNVFLLNYLPSADAVDVKVYLYGLTLACLESEDNTIDKMALNLKLPEERIISAFRYWEQKGLVAISSTFPLYITYYSPKKAMPPIVKYNVKKYQTFVEEVARLFPEKVLTPNEITAFIELIRLHNMDINAMLMIIKYCIDYKSEDISTPYILAVANDWIKKGLTTAEQVNEHINNLEANSEAIRMIFKTLGIKREATLEDRQFFLKWTLEYNYGLDAILTAARALKRRGGMERLDDYICELKNVQAFTSQEIAEYARKKQQIYELAVNVVKNMGGYYASMDMVIDTYIIPWLNKGFTDEALTIISKFCFLKNIRSLDSMEQMVNRFLKLGLLDENSINAYIEKQIAIDNKIKRIYEECNYLGMVSNKDRELYHTWLEWGFDDEIILFAASLARNNPFPMQSINRNLALLRQKNIATLEQAQRELENKQKSTDKPAKQAAYTDEQIKQVLVDFETWEL